MYEDTLPFTICHYVAYQAVLDALIEAAIGRHLAAESSLDFRFWQRAESACLEALCSVVDAWCACRIAEAFAEVRPAS
jgi:hypothetical protein